MIMRTICIIDENDSQLQVFFILKVEFFPKRQAEH
mgnify:CR=1 FL=1|jgi:hypothetical protein